jgi:hypothetical protein
MQKALLKIIYYLISPSQQNKTEKEELTILP